jgi:hypothetical protein
MALNKNGRVKKIRSFLGSAVVSGLLNCFILLETNII